MTSNDTFGRDLSGWLREDGEHRVPDHLAEVLVQTVATRQRPWWSSLERWLPMDTVATNRGANLRPIAFLLILGAIVAGVLGVAYVASRGPSLTPFGLAENGRIYVPTGDTITSYAPDGTDPQRFADTPGGTSALSMSPDGSHLAYWQGPDPGALLVKPLDGGDPIKILMPEGVFAGDQIAWSPDSTTIAFPAFRGSEEFLYTARADGSLATRLGGASIPGSTSIWWPSYSPDGDWISFLGVPGGAGKPPAAAELYLIHPDGTSLETIATGVDVEGAGAETWSPDPSVQRLLFTQNGTRMFDVATGKTTPLGLGFWASWAPDGKRIAAWSDGVIVVAPEDAPFTSDDYVRPHQSLTGACDDHPELAGKAVCSPVTWSPDGTRLLGMDIGHGGIVSLPADGQGDPVLLAAPGAESAAWQPIR